MISRPAPQYRSAGNTSGMVLKNIAQRMYSRGMLGTSADFHNGTETDGATPVLYATNRAERDLNLTAVLGTSTAKRLPAPKAVPAGTVPDVVGLGLREAIVTLEKAGYTLAFTGDGSVLSQTPAPGTRLAKGSEVHITLEKR